MPENRAEFPFPKRAWGKRLARLDRAWTRTESRLAASVLLAEIFAMCLWIALKGLSAEYETKGGGGRNVSGLVFRSFLSAVVLGFAAHLVTRPERGVREQVREGSAATRRHRVLVTSSTVLGLVLGRLWANVGVEYFSNVLNWMQNASLLMLIGGLRGVVTRLTLWLALLGGSLATAKGKHINIDIVMRFLTPTMRVPVAVLGWLVAAVMCVSGAWGFVDHIGIALFHVRANGACMEDRVDPASVRIAPRDCPLPPTEKLAQIAHAMRTDLFLVGRQLSLDARTLPRVVVGIRYNQYLTSAGWNAWVRGADWGAHFPPEAAVGLMAPEGPDDADPGETRLPAVSIPGGEEVRGLLVKDADFVFPFGLLMIAGRFLLRALLVVAGYVSVDPDLAHEEDDEEDRLV